MEKLIKMIKNKWLFLLTIIILLTAIISSFLTYHKEYYTYNDNYYNDLEKCRKTKDENICKIVNSIDPPEEKWKKEDAISLYFKINYNYFANSLLILGPLLLILLGINKFHTDFSSGNIKNYLTRTTLKDYRKKIYFNSLKYAFIIPSCLLIIFLICCFLTKFNFTIENSVKEEAIYDIWNYKNFPLYLFVHCTILYFMSIFYCNLSYIFLNKSKSKLLAAIFSFIAFFITVIFVYVIIYSLILNKMFGLSNLMNYFNIFDFFRIYTKYVNYLGILIVAISLAIISYITVALIYRNKEKVIIDNEKEAI